MVGDGYSNELCVCRVSKHWRCGPRKSLTLYSSHSTKPRSVYYLDAHNQLTFKDVGVISQTSFTIVTNFDTQNVLSKIHKKHFRVMLIHTFVCFNLILRQCKTWTVHTELETSCFSKLLTNTEAQNTFDSNILMSLQHVKD